MMVGIVFFDTAWRHVGITDGTDLIDARPGHGVQQRPMPDEWVYIFWLDREEGTAAWVNAQGRIGEPYIACSQFVCECIGCRCFLPEGLERVLKRGEHGKRA